MSGFGMRTLDALPEELPEDVKLELYKSCWAVQIGDSLYVFPQETTKAQAEEVLRRAYQLYKTRRN